MGYYVNTLYCNVTVKRENLERGYEIACALNASDKHKSGGHCGGAGLERPADSKSNGNPNSWYAWMPWNYDETDADLGLIMADLGFDISYSEEGDLRLDGYDSKAGDEDVFLGALAPVIEKGSAIVWHGEDDMLWTYRFDGEKVVFHLVDVEELLK